MTPSEIAREAAETIKWIPKDAEWQNNVTYVVEAAIEKATGLDQTTKHQAESWVKIVTMLVCDFGLEHTEPGGIAHEQIVNFLRRKLADAAMKGEA